jgi:uncharacterized membrane-anchored protein YhcB (DUF1043 family)
MMLDWTSPHVGFVIAAYAIVAFVWIGVLVAELRTASLLRQQLKQMNLSDPGQKGDA